MLRSEAEELKKVIDSFVQEDAEKVAALDIIEEGAVIPVLEVGDDVPEECVSKPVELTEDQLKKAFRHQVPENFVPASVEMVRSPLTGDRVFLKHGEERRWVPDLETLEAFGFNLGDVKDITDEELKELKEGFGLLSKKLW